MQISRRGFLGLLGLATATAATGAIELVEREPVRRFWQVPRSAPRLGLRDVMSGAHGALFNVDSENALDEHLSAMMRANKASFEKRMIQSMYNDPVSLSLAHGFFYAGVYTSVPTRAVLITNILKG